MTGRTRWSTYLNALPNGLQQDAHSRLGLDLCERVRRGIGSMKGLCGVKPFRPASSASLRAAGSPRMVLTTPAEVRTVAPDGSLMRETARLREMSKILYGTVCGTIFPIGAGTACGII